MNILDFLKDWARWADNVRLIGYASNSSLAIAIPGCVVAYQNRYGLCAALGNFIRHWELEYSDSYKLRCQLDDMLRRDFGDSQYPWGGDANYSGTASGANCGPRFAWVLDKIKHGGA